MSKFFDTKEAKEFVKQEMKDFDTNIFDARYPKKYLVVATEKYWNYF